MTEPSKAERELREKITTFLGEVYQPHQNFQDLPQGVQNDLLWETSEIEIFVKEFVKEAGYVQLAEDQTLPISLKTTVYKKIGYQSRDQKIMIKAGWRKVILEDKDG